MLPLELLSALLFALVGAFVFAFVLTPDAEAASRPRYGGEMRVLVPQALLDPERIDPAMMRSPLDLFLTRSVCEPLLAPSPTPNGVQSRLLQVPELDGRSRLVELKLKPGLRFASGAPLRARDVVQSLQRLGDLASPFRALLLPLNNGAGLVARSETEIAASFDFPYPDWSLGLTHPSSCANVGSHGKTGPGGTTGPFMLEGKLAAPASRLAANAESEVGRPFADKLSVRTASRADAARALRDNPSKKLGADVAMLKPVEGPMAVAGYWLANPKRPGLAPLPGLLAATLDRAELVRNYLPGPAVPLYGLLAPSVEARPVSAPTLQQASPLPERVNGELLVEAGEDDQRVVAERLQVKLHDFGAEFRVVPLARAELYARVARGDFDAALVSLPALPEAGLNLAQVLLMAGQPELARSELQSLGAIPDAATRRDRASARAKLLLPQLPLVPLYAQGLSAVARPAVNGLSFEPSGALDLGDLWLADTH
jgi:MarR-like DNA-binding transcriptional regulator SgrR of sgrS sRNA